MLQQISEQVGFNFVIELVPDNNYGAENKTTGEWNGLVRGTNLRTFCLLRLLRQKTCISNLIN